MIKINLSNELMRERIPSIFRLAPGNGCIYSVYVRSNMDMVLIEYVCCECGLTVTTGETFFGEENR